MNATLPEDLEPPTLSTMQTGETAWTLPWAIWVDRDRQCWLHPDYPAESRPGGTVSMRVELTADGYEVTAPDGETWQPQEQAGYAGVVLAFLPVAKVIR